MQSRSRSGVLNSHDNEKSSVKVQFKSIWTRSELSRRKVENVEFQLSTQPLQPPQPSTLGANYRVLGQRPSGEIAAEFATIAERLVACGHAY